MDDEYLYVGAYLFDNSPDSIARQIIKRDGWGYSDWFAMGVDSYYDRRTCFGFWVNPSGSMRDILHYNDTERDAYGMPYGKQKLPFMMMGWSSEMEDSLFLN